MISYKEAYERFVIQGRTDIQLCEEEYNGWKKKSKFFDNIENDFFWAVVSNVYKLKIVHPNRRKEKTKQTFLLKYGLEHSSQNKEVKNKSKQTCLKKFGTEYVLQNKNIRDKSKQTNLKRYGVEFAQQNILIKEKMESTNLNRYGVKNPRMLISNRFIKETEESLKDWLEKQSEPKPAYITLIQYFSNELITIKSLEDYLNNYKSNKSSLELLTEQLFELNHFNKKIGNTDLNYRPDFKLNDKIYLNVDGLYWHSNEQKENNYHFNIRKEFENNG